MDLVSPERGAPPRWPVWLVLACLGLLFAAPAVASPSEPGEQLPAPPVRIDTAPHVHDQWTKHDGLPQSTIVDIVQTQDGYLWLATYEGLVRFDGVRFTTFANWNTDALAHSRVASLQEGHDGALWAATRGGGLARYADGELAPYTGVPLPTDIVEVVYEDLAGRLWLGTDGAGLIQLHGHIARGYDLGSGLRDLSVVSLLQDVSGSLWIGTRAGGLHRLRDGVVTPLTTTPPTAHIKALYEDRDGRLWVGTWGHGVYVKEAGRWQRYTAATGLASDYVYDIRQDRRGTVWIGTREGLDRWEGGTLSHYSYYLSGQTVRSLFEDREGNLWAGTDSGLSRLKESNITNLSTRHGLPHPFARTVLQDRTGRFWIGTDGGGLARIDEDGMATYRVEDGLPYGRIRALLEDASGALWIGTNGGGLARLQNGRFTTYTTSDGLGSNSIRALLEDASGALWIGTNGGGLARLQNGHFTLYTTADGLPRNDILALHEDRTGALWIGTDGGGLARLQNGRFTLYDDRHGLPSNIAFSFYEDPESTLWIGTVAGLARFHEGTLEAYAGDEPALQGAVLALAADDHDHLWMTTNRGVVRVRRSDLQQAFGGERALQLLRIYGEADGMLSEECSGAAQPALWKALDGRLWVPTHGGLSVFDPSDTVYNDKRPGVVIEGLRTDLADVPLRPSDDLSLPAGHRKIALDYTGLSFVAPEKVRFRYKLDGFDRDWVQAGTQRTAYYTNLEPGTYTFQVVASNNDGIWNQEGAALTFTLRPYFYQTWWFAALAACAVLLAGFVAYRWRIQRLRQKELKALVWERTRELEVAKDEAERANRSKSIFLASLSHEIRTPMTGILGFADLIREEAAGTEQEQLAEFAGIIKRSGERLSTLLTDILDLSRIEAGRIELHPGAHALAPLVAEATSLFRPEADAKSIGLHLRIHAEPVVEVDEQRMMQVLMNVVKNAVKFTERGAVTVEVDYEAHRGPLSYGIVRVSDTGCGIGEAFMASLFEPFSQEGREAGEQRLGSGLGLSIAKKLVEAMGGVIRVTSELGGGTTVEIRVPASRVGALLRQ